MKKRLTSVCMMGALLLTLSGCTASNEKGDTSSSAENVVSTDTVSTAENVVSTDTVRTSELDEETVQDGAENGAGSTEHDFLIELENGTYMVEFDTDSSMFHVNEAMDGLARLTVKDGAAMLYLTMPSKNVLNLYEGLAADADSDESNWLNPVTELVTYEDGITEEVFAFYVPVYVIDEEFDLALIGKKNVWYDHKVSISNPQLIDKDYSTVEIEMEGGSGKAYIESPVRFSTSDGGYIVRFIWSSKNYDYMIVEDVKYMPVFVENHSVFEVNVSDMSIPLKVIADTTAMSEPHEIEYVITFIEEYIY